MDVTDDGVVVVTNGAGLTAYFENGGDTPVTLSVTASDGIDSVASEFILNKKGSWEVDAVTGRRDPIVTVPKLHRFTAAVAFDDQRVGDEDVTDLLRDVTDRGTTITLRGCFSYALAKRVKARLDGAGVWGAVRFMIGIPGTTIGIGVYR